MEFNKAKLISYSKMCDASGNELSLMEQVAFCARVSNPANQNSHQTSEKLCDYLLKNHHYSPFEMVNICVEVETTRDISRQILRHRSFTFQEFSQRYAEVADDFVLRECRLQHPSNRQMSVEINPDCNLDHLVDDKFQSIQKELIDLQRKYYELCVSNKVAKEQARCILSEGLTKTRLYINGNLRSWIHYIEIRSNTSTTQKEHSDLSIKIAEEIEKIFPMIRKYVWKPPVVVPTIRLDDIKIYNTKPPPQNDCIIL